MKFFEFPCGCKFPIDETRPLVHGHGAIIYDPRTAPLDCEATWDLISSGKTKGIFQLESGLGRTWSKKLKPREIEHLSALVAILRPGCLNNRDENGVSTTDHFCLRKNGLEEVTYPIPALEPILGPTYGLLVYQEQSMAIASQLAGFNLQEADVLRKAIGKKDTESMSKTRKLFLEKAHVAGLLTDEEAVAIFGEIQKSQRYSFNKCLSFDTKVLRSNGGSHSSSSPYTIEEMYRIRNDLAYAKATGHESLRRKWKRQGNYGKGLSMYEDGRIRPNTIVDIQPAGNRSVYQIGLENGATIRATGNHKFPTDQGEMTIDQMLGKQPIERLADGGTITVPNYRQISLYTCGKYEPSDFRVLNRYSDHTNETRYIGNGSFTNESYSKFQDFRKSTPDVCFDCGATGCRIETHHIDGNRTNSGPENLVKLCSSCHKKREYISGRTKRGEKGYPSVSMRITSIVEDGECMTYDVTMAAPHHNFVVESGIVTCNSHAVRYALNAYISAHEKTHFPLYFFTAYLRYAIEKQEPLIEIRQLINDARSFGYTVEPPRFVDQNKHFSTDGHKITFGLCDVKDIGEKKVDRMRAAIKEAESIIDTPPAEWDWYTFLVYFSEHVDAIVVKRMIEIGAFRDNTIPRQKMLAEFDVWKRLTDREREEITTLNKPLYKQEPVKTEEVYEDFRVPKGMKKRDILTQMTEDEAKEKFGVQRKSKKVNLKDEEGNVVYQVCRDESNEPIVLDPPRASSSLIEALTNLSKRPGSIATEKRRAKIDSRIKALRHPPRSLADTPHWIAKIEEENLGVPITCTHVESADKAVANTTIKEYVKGKRAEGMIIAAQIDELREFQIQNGPNRGAKMCRMAISDDTGSLEEVVMFSKCYADYGYMVQRAGVVVGLQGKRHWEDGNTFVVEKVWEL